MGVYMPASVVNSELQETVSRASIRRMIQGASNILAAASETQRNQRLAEVQAAGIEPSINNLVYVHRTDKDSIEYYDGASWKYVVPPPKTELVVGAGKKIAGGGNSQSGIGWDSRGTIPHVFPGFSTGSSLIRGSISVFEITETGCVLRMDNTGTVSGTIVPVALVIWP